MFFWSDNKNVDGLVLKSDVKAEKVQKRTKINWSVL